MANVTFTPNHKPAPACYPSDVNGMLDLLTTGGGLRGTIPDNAGGGVYVGSTPPSSALTNKVWYKTDGAGRPLGVYMFYNGNWRKVYTGVSYGEIRMYVGAYTPNFDGTGRGVVTGEADGWALCNGQNGTYNLEAYFLIGGQWSGSAWVTDVELDAWRSSGGTKGRMTINPSQAPSMSALLQYRNLAVTAGAQASVAVAQQGGPSYAMPVVVDATGQKGGGLPLPFPVLYFAVAYMMFVGYQ